MRDRQRLPLLKAIALLSTVLSLLAGCASSAGNSSNSAGQSPASSAATPNSSQAVASSGKPVEITFWSWASHLQERVDEFNQTHPNIKVNLLNVGAGGAHYTKLKVALEAKSGVPDVVQMEFQYLPTFVARGDLLNIADHGANSVKDQFIPWTWAQVSRGDAVYAIPQDAGPMVMMCREDLLKEHGLTIPQTWDEFGKAAVKIHQENPSRYLTNFSIDGGYYFGLLWQAGARPFALDGQNIKIHLTAPESMRVAGFWGQLLQAGAIMETNNYTDEWNAAISKGDLVCWSVGAWGANHLEQLLKDSPSSGHWRVAQLPQWTPGGKVSGNHGGSTSAVMKLSAHPREAAEFAIWLNSSRESTQALARDGFFPTTQSILQSPEWLASKPPLWGSQQIRQVMATSAQQVDVSFAWSPFQDYVYSVFEEQMTDVKAHKVSFEQAMRTIQEKVAAYAIDQGFTVTD